MEDEEVVDIVEHINSVPNMKEMVNQLPDNFSTFAKDLIDIFNSLVKGHAVNLTNYENLTHIVIKLYRKTTLI